VTFDQTNWVPVQQRRPLPTFYYHEHFLEMLDFVARHYAHTFEDTHAQFIQDFRALPREAQCLYVRLVNRKGRVFARNRLRYPELGNSGPLLAALADGNWIGLPEPRYFDEVLGFLTRAELYAIVIPRFAGIGRSLKKAELLDFVREHLPAEEFMAALDTTRILVQRRYEDVRYLMFLYFGRIREGLSQFTMRDLGLVRTQSFRETYEPRFGDRVEALEHYYFATRLRIAEKADTWRTEQLSAEADEWPEPNFPGSAALRDSLAYKLGRAAEKRQATDEALHLYSKGESAKCSERTMRLMLAQEDRDAARRYLERCLDDPRSDEEWLVAQDLYERKFEKKRTSTTTDMLREGEIIDIDESKSGSPERAVVEHFESLGYQAFRTENLLWRTLFGLLLWDELFVGEDSTLHSPFELLPTALANGTFYEDNKECVEARLASLRDLAATKKHILKTSAQFYGTANGVFRWRQTVVDALFAFLAQADAEAVAQVLRRLCQDYSNSRYGYPDLLVLDDDGVRFVEVKTEGDQLRRNQLVRLRQLRDAGFRADIARVRWILDPQQAYVVVDVETTGGRGENHRVTEIGAVKVRDGKVVDRFQTLLNPQRAIPPNIIRLTGITPAMVEKAPCFVDIADDFETFMQGAIFVAHNVEFDYGFIASEFSRIGRPFRFPKLCTCAGMRRTHPGHRSYSLAALCREYDIPLRQHHRAMCDAEAAAELLVLINEKRLCNKS
jgi:DNA polymerase-3 subunit epsilon